MPPGRKPKLKAERPRFGKKSSIVWNYFRNRPFENGVSTAECSLCGDVFKNPKGSTTGLRGHLERKHPNEWTISTGIKADPGVHYGGRKKLAGIRPKTERWMKKEPSPPRLTAEVDIGFGAAAVGSVGETEIFEEDFGEEEEEFAITSTSTTNGGNQRSLPNESSSSADLHFLRNNSEELTKTIVKYLVTSDTPRETLSSPSFSKMLLNVGKDYIHDIFHQGQQNSSLIVPVRQMMDQLYAELKEEIAERLASTQHLSLSLELWAKTNTEIYLITTVNYITEHWTHDTCFLGLRRLPSVFLLTPMKDLTEKISTILGTLLQEFSVDTDKIVGIVFNASPFKRESQELASIRILSHLTIPCFNAVLRECYTVLNDSVKAVATDRDVLEDALKLGKLSLANYKDLKRHPGRLMKSVQDFLEQNHLNAFNSVVFQSGPDVIQNYLKMQEPLNLIAEGMTDEPSLEISEILLLLYGARQMYTKQVDEEETSCCWSKEQKRDIGDRVLSHLMSSYAIDLDATNFDNDFLVTCMFLDPRHKALTLLTNEQRFGVYDTVTKMLNDMEKQSRTSDTGCIISVRTENPEFAILNEDPLNTSAAAVISTKSSSSKGRWTKMDTLLNMFASRSDVAAPTSDIEAEFRKYINERCPVRNSDPCRWWRNNKRRFPRIEALARKLLTVRAAATPGNLVFTLAGKEIFSDLQDMKPKQAEKVLCLRRHFSKFTVDQDALSDFGGDMSSNECEGETDAIYINEEDGIIDLELDREPEAGEVVEELEVGDVLVEEEGIHDSSASMMIEGEGSHDSSTSMMIEGEGIHDNSTSMMIEGVEI